MCFEVTNSVKATVAIWGASGATGGELLRQCLRDDRVSELRLFVRKRLDGLDASVRQVVVTDFYDVAAYVGELVGIDVAFWCLGVSQSAVPEESEHRRITEDFTMVAVEQLLAQSPAAAFHFVSAMGAESAWAQGMMWARVKRSAERKLKLAGLRRLVIWRPGYIDVPGGRNEPTWCEGCWERFSLFFRWIPSLVNSTPQIAQAMLEVALAEEGSTDRVLEKESRDILQLASEAELC